MMSMQNDKSDGTGCYNWPNCSDPQLDCLCHDVGKNVMMTKGITCIDIVLKFVHWKA